MHTKRQVYSRKRPWSEKPTKPSPLKTYKTRKKQKFEHPSGQELPAAFWDNLSKVWLTRNALRELDRRNNHDNQDSGRTVFDQKQLSRPLTRSVSRHIQKLALKGGLDLSDLRGYQKSVMVSHQSNYRVQKPGLRTARGSIASGSASRSASVSQTSKKTTSKSTGPYDRNFQQHLIDNSIYPYRYRFPDGHLSSKPDNLEEIKERLSRRRGSLSLSRFTEDDFEEFLQADADALKERQVTESVISIIEGTNAAGNCKSGGVPFKNLDHLTDGILVPGNPDLYHGSRPEQLDLQIRRELDDQIIPTTQHELPVLPNFFLAAKGPDGSLSVAGRQASYYGALGARGMHSLRTYGQDQPEFDNNAYTITCIYHGGSLKIFTSHICKPTISDRPEYHMTLINAFTMTGNIETFRQGATWYRNAKDWAKEQRDNIIRLANERAAHMSVEPGYMNTSFDTIHEASSEESDTGESSQRSRFSTIPSRSETTSTRHD